MPPHLKAHPSSLNPPSMPGPSAPTRWSTAREIDAFCCVPTTLQLPFPKRPPDCTVADTDKIGQIRYSRSAGKPISADAEALISGPHEEDIGSSRRRQGHYFQIAQYSD